MAQVVLASTAGTGTALRTRSSSVADETLGQTLARGRVPLGWSAAIIVALWLWCMAAGPLIAAAHQLGWVDAELVQSVSLPVLALWITISVTFALLFPVSLCALCLWMAATSYADRRTATLTAVLTSARLGGQVLGV